MNELPDPAAIFACATSLHAACLARADADASLNLSDAYQGMDMFMRELMRVADLFEKWACCHVEFEQLGEVWPYLLEEYFGGACLDMMEADALAEFDSDDCLRIAFRLRLPIRVDGFLPLPVCVEASNPLAGAEFRRLRIQTVRQDLDEEGNMAAFTEDDDPFDESYLTPLFGVYGVRGDDSLEHIADRASYQEARALLDALLPGVDLPEHVIAFVRPLTPPGAAASL